jgi:hypothetical protein
MYVCCREYEALPAIARKLVDHLKGSNGAPGAEAGLRDRRSGG